MITRQILTASGVFGLLVLSGCGRGNLVEGDFTQKTPDQIVVTDKHAVTLSVVDAATGRLVTAPVALQLRGSLAGSATDAFGKSITDVSVANGIAAFYLQSSGSLSVVAAAEGYFVGGTTFDVKDSIVSASIHLVNLASPPAGIEVGLNTGKADAGVLSDTLRITTPDGVIVVFPKGTSLETADGTSLDGQIQLSVLSYDIDSASVLASIPGGNEALKDSKEMPLQFLGVVGISLKDGSNRIASNADSFFITIAVPDDLVNPLTGKAFVEGDSVDIVNLSNSSARWTMGRSAVVTRVDSKLVVEFKVSEVGYWGLRVRQKTAGQSTCAPVVFKLPGMDGVNVGITLFKSGFYSSGFSMGYPQVSLNTLPDHELRLTAAWGSDSRYTTKGTYACGDSVTLNLEKSTTDVSETFAVAGICSQGGATSGLKGVEITLMRDGKFVTTVRTDATGAAVASGLSSNGQYTYQVSFGTQVVRGNFIAGGAPSVITTSVDCPEVTGATGASGD